MSGPAVTTNMRGGGVRHLLTVTWGGVTGAAPHVLHHVGPLAGVALLTGAVGQLAFLGVGLAATVPTLRRLRRRFGSWLAPGLALALFGVAFAISTFVVGPFIAGGEAPDPAAPAVEHDIHGH